MELDELMEEYSSELYSKYSLFFKYLKTINIFSIYLLQVAELLEDKIGTVDEYQSYIDLTAVIEITTEILSTIDEELVNKFNQYLNDGTINLDDEEEIGFSSMYIEDKKINIHIDRKYNIEDILALIHEFFHAIHIERFSNNMKDEKWYLFTEAVALIGELYAIIYMHKHNIMKYDLNSYYKKLMSAILVHADSSLLTGLTLEIFDSEGTISDESVEHFIDIKKMPKEYKDIGVLLEELDDFDFHISSTYVFGFPIAMLIASKMIGDESYSKKVFNVLKNIELYSIEDLLTFLGIGDILCDEEYIYKVMSFIHDISNEFIDNKQLELKKHYVEMR